jgi:hypothetical protein
LLSPDQLHVSGGSVLGAQVEYLGLTNLALLEPASCRRFMRRPKTETGSGCSGAPTNFIDASSFNQSKEAFE